MVLIEIVSGGRNVDVMEAPINFEFPAWPLRKYKRESAMKSFLVCDFLSIIDM
jgi:hypothetical protein